MELFPDIYIKGRTVMVSNEVIVKYVFQIVKLEVSLCMRKNGEVSLHMCLQLLLESIRSCRSCAVARTAAPSHNKLTNLLCHVVLLAKS